MSRIGSISNRDPKKKQKSFWFFGFKQRWWYRGVTYFVSLLIKNWLNDPIWIKIGWQHEGHYLWYFYFYCHITRECFTSGTRLYGHYLNHFCKLLSEQDNFKVKLKVLLKHWLCERTPWAGFSCSSADINHLSLPPSFSTVTRFVGE